MGSYGNVAVRAARSLETGAHLSPSDAWKDAAICEYPTQAASRKKACPRGAFIGLCEADLIRGATSTKLHSPSRNGEYAVAAANVLRDNPHLATDKKALWLIACPDQPKRPNNQMDVVIALYNAGLLQLER
ncbi:DUF6979 family protein [Neoaquamicrobium sediminum]|uniref:DUF6979 family protein n=1 Tax=Neoaquamicrobium sediminum TaxID=1849104 RepID=UPI0035E416BC